MDLGYGKSLLVVILQDTALCEVGASCFLFYFSQALLFSVLLNSCVLI